MRRSCCSGEGPGKGGWPVASSASRQPSENTSVGGRRGGRGRKGVGVKRRVQPRHVLESTRKKARSISVCVCADGRDNGKSTVLEELEGLHYGNSGHDGGKGWQPCVNECG